MSVIGRVGYAAILLCGASLFAAVLHRNGPLKDSDVELPAQIQLGEFSPDEVKDFSFKIKNNFKRDVIVERLVPSCGCTSVTIASSLVASGKDVTVHFDLRAHHNLYSIDEAIQVWLRDVKHPIGTVRLLGKVEAPYIVKPAVLNYGVVDFSELPQQAAFNLYPGTIRELPDDITATSTFDAVELSRAVENGKEGISFFATLKKVPVFGEIDGAVRVRSKLYQSPINVPYHVKIVGELTARPSLIMFVVQKNGEASKSEVSIDGADCQAMEWSIEPPHFTRLFKIETVDAGHLSVTATENREPSNQKFDAVLLGKTKNGKILSIPIHYKSVYL